MVLHKKFQFGVASLFLSIFLTTPALSQVDRSEVERVKDWARDRDSFMRSITELKTATALEFCLAIYELRAAGDLASVSALEWDQSVILQRKGYQSNSCPLEVDEMKAWVASGTNQTQLAEYGENRNEVERVKNLVRNTITIDARNPWQIASTEVIDYCTAAYELKRDGELVAWATLIEVQKSYLKLRGFDGYKCPEVPSEVFSWKSSVWVTETYNIDRLKIETRTRSAGCFVGSELIISLTGMIGPDSSFAMDQLLKQARACEDEKGNQVKPIVLLLNSGGGFLKDGYKLGQTLKQYNVRAKIGDDKVCASSCAVAFLGAADRVVEDKGQIMFHAPYFSGKNEYGERDIDCDVGDEALSELNDYYISMTDTETGDRLFERTMWYCSANDGWVVTGGAAAVLYGIATER